MRIARIGVLFLIASVIPGTAANGPTPAALEFLEALKAGDGEVEDVLAASALSPYCGEAKREQIAQRLARLGRSLRRDGAVLVAAGERRDGKFAAVLVAAESAGNPLDVEVHAVGVREDRGNWKAAPVPGSFDNAYVGFDDAVEKRLADLEGWMSAERIMRLQQLQVKAEERLRARMNKAVPARLLEKGRPGEVLEGFLKACVAQDLAAVLVFLGDDEPADAEERAGLRSVAANGLQGVDRAGHWHLLTSPAVVRVVAEENRAGNEADAVLMFYDPADATGVKLVRFQLYRSAGRWRIELPDVFRIGDKHELRLRNAPWHGLDADDDKMRKKFGRYFEKAREARREASVEEVGVAIEGLLREGDLEGLFRFLHRSDDISDGERRIAYAEVAQFFSMFRGGGKEPSEGLLVDTLKQGGAGLLVFNEVSSAHLDRIKLTPVLLIEGEGGWGIAPGVTSRGNFDLLDEKLRKDQAVVFAEYTDLRKSLEKEAASRFLNRFTRAAPAGAAEASEEEVRKLVTEFRTLLRSGRLLEAFDHCALLDRGEGAWEALTSLSYEYRGTKRAVEPDHVLAVQCEGPWAAVSLRLDAGPGDEPDYPMYLVVVTGEGPRIVVDAGLRLVTNKGREILNSRIWKRIDACVGKEEAGLVRRLFRVHVTKSTEDRNEWLKSTKSSP